MAKQLWTVAPRRRATPLTGVLLSMRLAALGRTTQQRSTGFSRWSRLRLRQSRQTALSSAGSDFSGGGQVLLDDAPVELPRSLLMAKGE